MEQVTMYWLIAIVVFIVIELATMGLTTIWFAGGAIAGFAASLLGAGLGIQVGLFLAVSLVLLVFTRPFAAKYINRNHVATNVDSLIGKNGMVTVDIDNLKETGSIQLDGKEWTARSLEEKTKISKGTEVTVRSISGVKAIVEVKKEEV